MKKNKIAVIGAGLAGCEASWQAAKQGAAVDLFEMRPLVSTGAHKTELPAELVCSNSLGSLGASTASGCLKHELLMLDSLLIKCAEDSRVPAGGSLAVDRQLFSKAIEKKIKQNPQINIIRKEITKVPDDYEIIIIATGPLTSESFSQAIKELIGGEFLCFFDATSPIVSADSVNYNTAYFASRYQKGDPDFLNCPMNKEEYEQFYLEIIKADVVPLKEFESNLFFEGCLPVEEIARRGKDTLRFGPLKPVGLPDPKGGKIPYAVVQLRPENFNKTMYNLVGFQTRLCINEQKRVFRLIPGLEKTVFLRYGLMHRNTFINAPKLLEETLQLKENPNIFFAGQITGVEGYVESTASGWLAGVNAARLLLNKKPLSAPQKTFIGSLMKYITSSSIINFQPMNVNWGLLPCDKKVSKKEKKEKILKSAQEELHHFISNTLSQANALQEIVE